MSSARAQAAYDLSHLVAAVGYIDAMATSTAEDRSSDSEDGSSDSEDGSSDSEDLKAYMIDYYPWHGGKGVKDSDSNTLRYLKGDRLYDKSKESQFIARTVKWLTDQIKDIKVDMIAIAPGHSVGKHHGFLQKIVAKMPQHMDGCHLLQRTVEVEKATEGGPRNQTLHEQTICVDQKKVSGKVVILDDVWTTGSTLRACESVMLKAGAKAVYLYAIGKTV